MAETIDALIKYRFRVVVVVVIRRILQLVVIDCMHDRNRLVVLAVDDGMKLLAVDVRRQPMQKNIFQIPILANSDNNYIND